MNKWQYGIKNLHTNALTPIKFGFELVKNNQQKLIPSGKKLTIESVFAGLKAGEVLVRFKENSRTIEFFSGDAQIRQWSILA